MRDAFHEELDTITDQLVEMARLVGSPMAARHHGAARRRRPTSPRASSRPTSESTPLREELEDRCFDLLARQQPVATDLRIVVTVAADGRRPRADGRPRRARRQDRPAALPRDRPSRAELHAHDRPEMGQVAEAWSPRPADVIAQPGRRGRAAARGATTTRWTSCTASCSRTLLAERWTHGVEAAVDLDPARPLLRALRRPRRLGRRRVVFLVTGEFQRDELDHESARTTATRGCSAEHHRPPEGLRTRVVRPCAVGAGVSDPGWRPPRRPRRPPRGRGSARRASIGREVVVELVDQRACRWGC